MAPQDDDRTEDAGAAPPAPPHAPSDWASVVHDDAWTDVERLGRWRGGPTKILVGEDPSSGFTGVARGTLGGGASPAPIYVVVHGWAPGYLPVVAGTGGRTRWWAPDAHIPDGRIPRRWASDWCWSPAATTGSSSSPGVVIDDTGVVQQIHAYDSTATILAYSWIDDSATASGTLHLPEVYRSEAYTHLNGIRLANALQQAIVPTFFTNGGQLHLIGHSHGSRVCTVAAKTLQDRKAPATHLTILDSPDSVTTRLANASNLLGVHLETLDIRDPMSSGPGLFVDSYASCFGVRWDSASPTSPVRNVVNVSLTPSHLYGDLDPSDCHTYAASWYGGAAAGANRGNQLPIGLAWPPVPPDHTPAMGQHWQGGAEDQWTLQAGPSVAPTCHAITDPVTVTEVARSAGVQDTGGTIAFRPASGEAWSWYEGRYPVDVFVDFGLAFDLTWSAPSPHGRFVVAIGHGRGSYLYTLLVLDGRSVPPGTTTTIALNSYVLDGHAQVRMYYRADPAASGDVLTVSNLRSVEVR